MCGMCAPPYGHVCAVVRLRVALILRFPTMNHIGYFDSRKGGAE